MSSKAIMDEKAVYAINIVEANAHNKAVINLCGKNTG